MKVQSTDQPNFVQHGPAPATASLGVIEPVPGELHLRSTRVTGYAEIKTTLHCAELKRAEAILTKGDVRWALEVEIVTIPEFWTPQLTRERVQQTASGPSFLGSLVRFSARYARAIPVQYLGWIELITAVSHCEDNNASGTTQHGSCPVRSCRLG